MHANARVQRLTDGNGIDWGTAEAMAFGSLLVQVSILGCKKCLDLRGLKRSIAQQANKEGCK